MIAFTCCLVITKINHLYLARSIFVTTKFDNTGLHLTLISSPSCFRFDNTQFPFMFQVCLSVILTAVGVLIAALRDFSFDLFGYSMALTSVFFQVGYDVLFTDQCVLYLLRIICYGN